MKHIQIYYNIYSISYITNNDVVCLYAYTQSVTNIYAIQLLDSPDSFFKSIRYLSIFKQLSLIQSL